MKVPTVQTSNITFKGCSYPRRFGIPPIRVNNEPDCFNGIDHPFKDDGTFEYPGYPGKLNLLA